MSVQEQLRDVLKMHGAKLMDLFREWDDDGNGAVDKHEFRKAIAALGYDAPKSQIDALFNSMDEDGSGWIEYHELKDALNGKQIGGKKAMELRPDDKLDLILAEEAEKFLAAQKADQPFFLYLAWEAPHNMINPAPEFRGKSKAGIYGDYVQQLDHCVGRVLDALEKQGLAKNTLVIFTSDNAGRYQQAALRAGHRTNGELLGQKTDVWEGGHRVSFLARWPERFPAGKEQKGFFHQVDLMATLADAAGATLPEGASPDGHSELAAMLDPETSPTKRTEAILHGTRSLSLRQGSWVYIPEQGSGGKTVPEPEKPWSLSYREMLFQNSDVDERGQIKPGSAKEQLYNLDQDLGQHTNLANSDPERLRAMRDRFADLTKGQKGTKDIGSE
jgi:arylsulfatase A-like enzyme